MSTQADHAVGHVLPLRIYFGVYFALLVLTVVTVGVSYADLGSTAIVVALAVAIVKATLVAMYFMHLRYDDRFHAFILLASVAFLLLFFAFTFIDLTSRGMILKEEDNFTFRNEQAAADKAAAQAAAPAAAPAAPAAH